MAVSAGSIAVPQEQTVFAVKLTGHRAERRFQPVAISMPGSGERPFSLTKIMRRHVPLVLVSVLTFSSASVHGQDRDLTNLDLDTLMGMDVAVTSATRRAQAAANAAAAVYVITRDDIRRSGATTLPEVLRYVPGLRVAQINSRGWAVTSRGSSSRFANKLLVMIDGRSLYSSVFSGVLWEEQSVALEEIERIEILRGPGGALWGINAVNGVINVITRMAADARGLRATGGAWWPTTGIELSFSVDNIFDEEHVEFFDDIALRPGATLGRSYFARFTVRPKR